MLSIFLIEKLISALDSRFQGCLESSSLELTPHERQLKLKQIEKEFQDTADVNKKLETENQKIEANHYQLFELFSALYLSGMKKP